MTERHVSLLRGINGGGHNLVSMARLRALYEALGCEHVATYLQSGNVVFRRARNPGGRSRLNELSADQRSGQRSSKTVSAAGSRASPGADFGRRAASDG